MRAPPLCTDGSNDFARYSMQVRVPKILDDVVEKNSDFSPSVRRPVGRLGDDIASDRSLPALGFPAPDYDEWHDELERRRGATWLNAEWFFVECYVYRALMAAVRYWETERDPFAPFKRDEL